MSRRAVQFMKTYVNRNPLNNQLLGLQSPPKGFEFEMHPGQRNFLYKVELKQHGSHQEATISHFKDGVILQASTKERSISNQLYSNTDTAAALNLGRILALKALQSGILRVAAGKTEKDDASKHQKAFYDALTEGGLIIGELKPLEIHYRVDKNLTWERFPIHHNRDDKIDDDEAAKERK